MAVIIFGASGFLGSELLSYYEHNGVKIVGTYSNSKKNRLLHFDLKNPEVNKLILESKLGLENVTHAIICSAVTNMDKCRTEWDETYKINVDGIKKLISELFNLDITPVFISTDYVFEGTKGHYSESDDRKPVLAYGMQKKEVEDFLLSSNKSYIIARMSKMYSTNYAHKTILTSFVEDLKNGKELILAKDQIFSPTLVDDVCKAVYLLTESNAEGVFNICASDAISRYDFGSIVKDNLEIDTGKITACNLRDILYMFKDNRPLNTSMNNTKFTDKYNFKFKTVKESMDSMNL